MSDQDQQQNQDQQQPHQPPLFMPQMAAFASMFPGGMPNFGNFMAGGGLQRPHGDNTDEMISTIESNMYRDNSKMTEADVDGELRNKRVSSRKEPTFPMKLHQMLSDPDAEGVIVWLPHGRAWKLVKADQFERVLLPRYFDHGNISSFMRQVNGWDFRRIVKGVDEQSYYHELFLRGMPHLCKMMTRTKKSKKKTGICSPKMLSITPDFYRMDVLPGCEGFVPPPAADDGKKDGDDNAAAKKGEEQDSSKPVAAATVPSIAGMPPGMPGFMPGMPMAAQMTFFNSMMMGANPNFFSQLSGGMPPLPAAAAAPADGETDRGDGDAAAPADEEEAAEETADVSV